MNHLAVRRSELDASNEFSTGDAAKRPYCAPQHQRVSVAESTRGKNNPGFEAGMGMGVVAS